MVSVNSLKHNFSHFHIKVIIYFTEECPQEAVCLGNISLFFMKASGTWFDAFMACQNHESHLASFNQFQLKSILEEVERYQLGGHFAVGIYRSGWHLDSIKKDEGEE